MVRHRLFPLALLAGVAVASFTAGSVSRAQAPRMTVAYNATPHAGLTAAFLRDTAKVYTDSQATAGQAVFAKVCAECHETKDVTGADFRTKWKGQSVFALFEQIRTTMPDGNPGTLSRDEYISTVAYILKLNGLPAGDKALATDSVALSVITLELPPPSSH